MHACRPVANLGAWLFLVAPAVMANDMMPASEQNALIQKYCAVCHNDSYVNGGLSLQHFDAAKPDPSVVAMILSKVRDGGAMGAAGRGVPDRATEDAFVRALTVEAAGAHAWTVNRTQDPIKNAAVLTASIVQETPSGRKAWAMDMYRLTLTCRPDTHEGEMQLSWSPGGPPEGQEMTAAVDDTTPVTYRIEGKEQMATGGTSGPGAVILYTTAGTSGPSKLPKALPEQALTVSNVLPNQKIVFPFADLPATARRDFSACLAR